MNERVGMVCYTLRDTLPLEEGGAVSSSVVRCLVEIVQDGLW